MYKIKKGFNLVELMFVITTLSVIATITISNLSNVDNLKKIEIMKNDIYRVVEHLREQYAIKLLKEGNSQITIERQTNSTDIDNTIFKIGSNEIYTLFQEKGREITVSSSNNSCILNIILEVTDIKIDNTKVVYNTCLDDEIRVVTF